MSDFVEDLEVIEQLAWDRLRDAVASHRAAFHTGTVATSGLDGSPQLRTVVLRAAERASRTLVFHTDRRSPKFLELSADPRLSWLFYDGPSRMQLRLQAVASLHGSDARADSHWAATTVDSRRAYAAEDPPGCALADPGDGLPEEAHDQRWTLAVSECGRPHFAVVLSRVSRLEVLLLHHRGHRRAAFDYDSVEPYRIARWLIP
jgi:pyridoxine/pyridoxamine 5'-phosphate oxidase